MHLKIQFLVMVVPSEGSQVLLNVLLSPDTHTQAVERSSLAIGTIITSLALQPGFPVMVFIAGYSSKCLGAIPLAVEPLLCCAAESAPGGTVSS